jgi:hypothetical protein
MTLRKSLLLGVGVSVVVAGVLNVERQNREAADAAIAASDAVFEETQRRIWDNKYAPLDEPEVCDEDSCPQPALLEDPPEAGEPQEAEPAQDAPPASIEWVTPAEAAASPKPDWFHVSWSQGCAPCARATQLLNSTSVARLSQQFDCVLIEDADNNHPWMRWWGLTRVPTDLFVSADGSRWSRQVGCPSEYPSRLRQGAGSVAE